MSTTTRSAAAAHRTSTEPRDFNYEHDPRYLEATRRLAAKRAEQAALGQDGSLHERRREELASQRDALETKRELGEATAGDVHTLAEAIRQNEDAAREHASRARILEHAVRELERRLASVAGEIQQEFRPQVLDAMQAKAQELAPLLRQAARVNAELLAMARQASGWMAVLPVHGLTELLLDEDPHGDVFTRSDGGMSALSCWFRACRDAGYDV